jgi:hypothetical protein
MAQNIIITMSDQINPPTKKIAIFREDSSVNLAVQWLTMFEQLQSGLI